MTAYCAYCVHWEGEVDHQAEDLGLTPYNSTGRALDPSEIGPPHDECLDAILRYVDEEWL